MPSGNQNPENRKPGSRESVDRGSVEQGLAPGDVLAFAEDMLSYVEDEKRGLEPSMTADERDEMLTRIRSRPADRALYEQFRSSVSALRSAPRLDAPASVWEQIEVRFESVLEAGSKARRVTPLRPATPAQNWAIRVRQGLRVRQRLAASAAAAACLLAAVLGSLWLTSRGDIGNGRPTPSQRILFVKADPKPNDYRASVAVAEFLTKATRRYRGVSADELDQILRMPANDG